MNQKIYYIFKIRKSQILFTLTVDHFLNFSLIQAGGGEASLSPSRLFPAGEKY